MSNVTYQLDNSKLTVEIGRFHLRNILCGVGERLRKCNRRWSRLVEEIAIFITSKRAKVSERETDFPFELRVNLGGEGSQW